MCGRGSLEGKQESWCPGGGRTLGSFALSAQWLSGHLEMYRFPGKGPLSFTCSLLLTPGKAIYSLPSFVAALQGDLLEVPRHWAAGQLWAPAAVMLPSPEVTPGSPCLYRSAHLQSLLHRHARLLARPSSAHSETIRSQVQHHGERR